MGKDKSGLGNRVLEIEVCHLKHYSDRFIEIEKRVNKLVLQNRDLKIRVNELRDELEKAQHTVKLLEHLHGEKRHIREKIQRLLQSLEGIKGRE